MKPSDRAIGADLEHLAQRRLMHVATHIGATAMALGCMAACGADKSGSNNAAATSTAPAVVTTQQTEPPGSPPVPVSPAGSLPTGIDTTPAPTPSVPAPATNTSPTDNGAPAADTGAVDSSTGAASAEDVSSEADPVSTGAQSTDSPGTGPQDTDAPSTAPGTSGPSAGCGKAPSLTSGNLTIDVDGSAREYILKLPNDYDSSKPYKLIFGLHWRGGQASDVATGGSAGLGNYYGLDDLADGSAIFVAPNGLDNGWANTGGRDIAFLKALLAKFQDDLCIDLDRVFSVGFSYGGMMSFAIACEMGDVFRAIAPLSGALYSGCGNGADPIAMWGAHGTADDVVPINDGRAGLQEVLERNHCGTETTPTSPDPCVTYSGCDEGYPVTWCEFDGGHGPQRWQVQPIWEFFSQF